MAMYYKDKTETLKAKITMEQDEFLMSMSVALGVSKSEAVRIIIDSYRHGGQQHENKQTNFDH